MAFVVTSFTLLCVLLTLLYAQVEAFVSVLPRLPSSLSAQTTRLPSRRLSWRTTTPIDKPIWPTAFNKEVGGSSAVVDPHEPASVFSLIQKQQQQQHLHSTASLDFVDGNNPSQSTQSTVTRMGLSPLMCFSRKQDHAQTTNTWSCIPNGKKRLSSRSMTTVVLLRLFGWYDQKTIGSLCTTVFSTLRFFKGRPRLFAVTTRGRVAVAAYKAKVVRVMTCLALWCLLLQSHNQSVLAAVWDGGATTSHPNAIEIVDNFHESFVAHRQLGPKPMLQERLGPERKSSATKSQVAGLLEDESVQTKSNAGGLESYTFATSDASVANKVDSLDAKVDVLGNKVDSLDIKVDAMDIKMGAMEHKVDTLDIKMDAIEHKVDAMDIKMDAMEHKVDALAINMGLESKALSNEIKALSNEIKALSNELTHQFTALSNHVTNQLVAQDNKIAQLLLKVVGLSVVWSEIRFLFNRVSARDNTVSTPPPTNTQIFKALRQTRLFTWRRKTLNEGDRADDK